MIAFTEYVRPRGERRTIYIERPSEIESMAAELVEVGAFFETERIGQAVYFSICVLDEKGEELILANALVPNGPKVPRAVDTLVRKSHEYATLIELIGAVEAQ